MDADAVMLTVIVCWLNETFQQQWFWCVGNKKTYTLDLLLYNSLNNLDFLSLTGVVYGCVLMYNLS